ncbi:MAG: DnaD domain protein [SAR202 cluster bacterium]|nr:DnaD domain protein [SAR202 cluster bacterium]
MPTRFDGFPSNARQVPVPAPLLGDLLSAIDDVAELKCTLRFFWHLAQERGSPRAVPAERLRDDDVLRAALGSPDAVARGLDAAVERGTLLLGALADGSMAYLAHTPEHRRFASSSGAAKPTQGTVPAAARAGAPEVPNVYALYEQHIGLLTPMMADVLRDAEQTYPAYWIEEAFREAVLSNRRSWRYVQRILERWATEGRGDGTHGKSGGHPPALTAAEYVRRYGRNTGRRA